MSERTERFGQITTAARSIDGGVYRLELGPDGRRRVYRNGRLYATERAPQIPFACAVPSRPPRGRRWPWLLAGFLLGRWW